MSADIEWGLFNDEGLVEGGFSSETEAEACRITMYDEEDELEALAICPEHPDHALVGCEECEAGDDEGPEGDQKEPWDEGGWG